MHLHALVQQAQADTLVAEEVVRVLFEGLHAVHIPFARAHCRLAAHPDRLADVEGQMFPTGGQVDHLRMGLKGRSGKGEGEPSVRQPLLLIFQNCKNKIVKLINNTAGT